MNMGTIRNSILIPFSLATFWYMPRDLASRISWFYCTSALSGAFSGLLAAALAKMDGVGGYEGEDILFGVLGV